MRGQNGYEGSFALPLLECFIDQLAKGMLEPCSLDDAQLLDRAGETPRIREREQALVVTMAFRRRRHTKDGRS